MRRTILIISDDLGFLFWCGRLLCDSGFNPLPATGPDCAPDLIDHALDGIVIDLTCVNAAFLKHVRNYRREAQVLLVREEDQNVDQLVEALQAHCLQKPRTGDHRSRAEWVQHVGFVFGTACVEMRYC